MSKATRNGARSARERIALQQAAARRAEQRRRFLIIGGSVGLVIVIVVALVLVKALSKPPKQAGQGGLPAAVQHQITSVPASTLAKTGTGPLQGTLPIKSVSDKPLTSNGKPEMLYIGAEYCPYCAAMRWPMAVALSRFGTFGPLKGIHSSSTDVYPNTPTLTFLHQRYTSKYLTFTPVENEGEQHQQIQPVTSAQKALWVKYDTTNGSQGFPFIDFGNKAVLTGPLFVPSVLHGLTWAQVASKLSNPNDPVGANVGGAANYMTAAICKMTNNQPGSVCKTGPIPSIESKL
jgi:thiol-disulfide isomerase/thioredoxin